MKRLCKDIEVGAMLALEVIDNNTMTDWVDKDEAQTLTPISLLINGEFLGENKEFIYIADMGCSNDLVKNVHVVPKAVIVWMDVVMKVKRIYETNKFDKCFNKVKK